MRRWLTNPFHYLAGVQALALGVVVLGLAALLASLGNIHFDGIIDAHYGAPLGFFSAFVQGIVNALLMTAVLVPFALVLARPGMRLLDLLGTQCLARAPFALVALIMGLMPLFVALPDMSSAAAVMIAPTPEQTVALLAVGLASLLPVLWSIYLMYRSFCVCTGVGGGKATACFALALIIAEVTSKVVHGMWLRAL